MLWLKFFWYKHLPGSSIEIFQHSFFFLWGQFYITNQTRNLPLSHPAINALFSLVCLQACTHARLSIGPLPPLKLCEQFAKSTFLREIIVTWPILTSKFVFPCLNIDYKSTTLTSMLTYSSEHWPNYFKIYQAYLHYQILKSYNKACN